MKKTLALLLAVLLVVAMFAGCGKDTTTTPTTPDTPTTPETSAPADTPDTPDTGADEPVVEDSPYKFPVGKYEVGEDGFPTGKYEYELPLSTTDEVFTYWTTCYTPQFVPETGYGSMPYQTELENRTGVHIEYELIPADQRQANFSVLMAADDLRDLSGGAVSVYQGNLRSAIEDEWFANLYDYFDYMPNYMYEVISRNDLDTYARVFYDKDMILAFYSMKDVVMPEYGLAIRGDWCDDLGIDWASINTYDEMYEAMKMFKANGVLYPFTMMSTIEQMSGYFLCGYNTSGYVREGFMPYTRLGYDGKVEFTLTTDDDRDAMTMINKWFSEDLIDKKWAEWDDALGGLRTSVVNNEIGIYPANPSGMDRLEAETDDPDCVWEPLPRTLRTEDQKLVYGQKDSHFNFGSTSISAKCSNIPLLVTWMDWQYSYEGFFLGSYGVEGHLHYIDENGKPMLTDWCLNNPDGLNSSFAMIMHASNGLVDGGMKGSYSRYAYPGGDYAIKYHEAWTTKDYRGEMDVPSVTLTEEESEELASYSNDLATFISENYLAFVDNSKPMSEWDAYVASLYDLGLAECEAIYQAAYERFMASIA